MLNLTQHEATQTQIDEGVVDPDKELREGLKEALTFDSIPGPDEIQHRAEWIAELAAQEDTVSAMIGGAPFLMAPLEAALKQVGVTPYYAFSVRESVEKVDRDGNVVKVNVFKHQGFIEAG